LTGPTNVLDETNPNRKYLAFQKYYHRLASSHEITDAAYDDEETKLRWQVLDAGSGGEWRSLDEETAKALESARDSGKANIDVGELSYDFKNWRYSKNGEPAGSEPNFRRRPPQIIRFDRLKEDWSATKFEGSQIQHQFAHVRLLHLNKVKKTYQNNTEADAETLLNTQYNAKCLVSRRLPCDCPPCFEHDYDNCECKPWVGEFESHPIMYEYDKEKPRSRTSRTVRLQEEREGDLNEAKARWLIRNKKKGKFCAVARGSNDYWLCRLLENPYRNPKKRHMGMGSHSTHWQLKQDEWAVNVMWFHEPDGEGTGYVEEREDTVTVAAVMLLEEELELEEKAEPGAALGAPPKFWLTLESRELLASVEWSHVTDAQQ